MFSESETPEQEAAEEAAEQEPTPTPVPVPTPEPIPTPEPVPAPVVEETQAEIRVRRDKAKAELERAQAESAAANAEIPHNQPRVDAAAEAVTAATAALEEVEALVVPVVLAFGCPNCEVATFIGEKRSPLAGGPAIPRGVTCPVCGSGMILQDPFVVAQNLDPIPNLTGAVEEAKAKLAVAQQAKDKADAKVVAAQEKAAANPADGALVGAVVFAQNDAQKAASALDVAGVELEKAEADLAAAKAPAPAPADALPF